jgi:hypothetical protein
VQPGQLGHARRGPIRLVEVAEIGGVYAPSFGGVGADLESYALALPYRRHDSAVQVKGRAESARGGLEARVVVIVTELVQNFR